MKSNDSIDRSRYVYEGPNGTPRNKRDYSPNERLRQRIPIVRSSDIEPMCPAWSVAQHCRRAA